MIRRFALENEFGARYDLNDPTTGVFLSPQGLGFEFDSNYTSIGDSFIRDYLRNKQQTVSGTIAFESSKAYLNYQALNDFINSADSLKLFYSTDAGDYYRDIDIVSINKSELGHNKVLECPVKFICKSLFYSNHVNRFKIERVEGEARWDFRWDVRFNDYGSRAVNVSNNGHVPAPFEVEIFGYCENPAVIVKQNGKEVAKVSFPTTLQDGEKIMYSSLDGNLYCYRVNTAGVKENFTSKLDLFSTNFFKLPVGDCQVEFTSDTGAANRTLLTVYKFFRTV